MDTVKDFQNRQLLLRSLRSDEINDETLDDIISSRIIEKLHQSQVKNIYIILPDSIDSEYFLKIDQVYSKEGLNVETFLLQDLESRNYQFLKEILQQIKESYEKDSCLIISGGKALAGFFISCYFILSGKNLNDALSSVQDIDNSLLRNEKTISFIEEFYDYINFDIKKTEKYSGKYTEDGHDEIEDTSGEVQKESEAGESAASDNKEEEPPAEDEIIEDRIEDDKAATNEEVFEEETETLPEEDIQDEEAEIPEPDDSIEKVELEEDGSAEDEIVEDDQKDKKLGKNENAFEEETGEFSEDGEVDEESDISAPELINEKAEFAEETQIEDEIVEDKLEDTELEKDEGGPGDDKVFTSHDDISEIGGEDLELEESDRDFSAEDFNPTEEDIIDDDNIETGFDSDEEDFILEETSPDEAVSDDSSDDASLEENATDLSAGNNESQTVSGEFSEDSDFTREKTEETSSEDAAEDKEGLPEVVQPRTGEDSFYEVLKIRADSALETIEKGKWHGSFLNRFNIKTKLLVLNSIIIIISLSVMIFLATYFFRSDNEIRVKENNHNMAQMMGNQVQANINALIEKAGIIARSSISDIESQNQEKFLKEIFFQKEGDIIAFSIAENKNNELEYRNFHFNKFYLEENHVSEIDLKKIFYANRGIFGKAFSGLNIFHNVSADFKSPVLGLGFSLGNRNGKSTIAVLYIRLQRLLKIFATTGITRAFMVNDTGEVIAHWDSKLVLSRVNMMNLGIVKKMMESKLDNGQMRYTGDDGLYYLGSFKKLTAFGLGIIVSVNEDKVFQEVYNIQRRNIIILLIVLNLSILGAFFFARTLSNPVINLVRATERFHEKELPAEAVKGKDEVEYLSQSFTVMVDSILESQKKLQDYANNLERMVEQRTAQLKEARDALWGEMELAKKIQTVLLPLEPSMPGYEITGYMMPADEVGGDYYDIINIAGKDWVILGDVSGHGVPAGLVMMMVQTSIRIVLSQHPDISPSNLLSVVNGVISKNIKQFSKGAYMTITACACYEDGRFSFAGLHLDILIYRAATGEVDYVQTNGMWIGIMDDIGKYLTDNTFQLNSNDLFILYTDGITESFDNEDKIFSKDRLAEVLKEYGRGSVDDVKNGVLKAMEGYRTDDDVTMVVVKRV